MIANILTFSRLLATVPLVYLLLNGYDLLTMFLLLLALLTDIFDGMVARKFNQVTQIGATLDPIIDKILYISMLLSFIFLGYISSIGVILILLRELLIMGLRGLCITGGEVVSAKKHGKLKAVLQSISIFIIIVMKNHWISELIIDITAALTIYSGYKYLDTMLLIIERVDKNKK